MKKHKFYTQKKTVLRTTSFYIPFLLFKIPTEPFNVHPHYLQLVENNCWSLAVFRVKLPNGQPFPKGIGPLGQIDSLTYTLWQVSGHGYMLHACIASLEGEKEAYTLLVFCHLH